MEINRRSILKGLLCLPLLSISNSDYQVSMGRDRQGSLTDSLKDSRFLDLTKLMKRVEGEKPLRLHLCSNQNVYLLEHVVRDSSIKKTKGYFGQKMTRSKEDKLYNEYSHIDREASVLIAWGTTVQIQYLKEFKDRLIQIAGFGGEWGTMPNTCWALYGHIVSEQGK